MKMKHSTNIFEMLFLIKSEIAYKEMGAHVMFGIEHRSKYFADLDRLG